MKFVLQPGDFETNHYDCIIVGVYENRQLTPAATKLNKMTGGFIEKILKTEEIEGKVGQTLFLYHLPKIASTRILLVGCGKKENLNLHHFLKVVGNSIAAVDKSKAKNVLFTPIELPVMEQDLNWKIKQTVIKSFDVLYLFQQFKTHSLRKNSLEKIFLPIKKSLAVNAALEEGLAIAHAVQSTKDLANLPSNICTPTYLAEAAKKLSKQYKKITLKVLTEKEIKKLGMGAFLAVAKGSEEEARLICLEYRGSKKPPIALIGKGITFDTGGISLKPADAMLGMKYDMCGAATVLGTLQAVAELNLPCHVVGIIAAAENMPSGTATKPEDIVTTLSGKTVEIMNTDAEGRLVLCDAITYSERYEPKVIIDIATLTGSIVYALGTHATGLFTNDEPLAKELIAAGNETQDRVWPMPLWEEYQDQLKSPFADISNVGGRAGGAITAACFLSRFAKGYRWAHLDVAGTAAMMGGTERYATGRPVPLLVQYLINQC